MATTIHTDLMLYNTLHRKKEKFVPLDVTGKTVTLYTCGPTVYNFMHIGNLRSFLFEDILKRTLIFSGYKVKHVMNITDVGHLTGEDDDSGEDKMLKGARREGKSVWDVAAFYTDAFKRDYLAMNMTAPFVWCKATDHIKEQISMICTLEKKGFTYFAGGNVYFDSSKLKDYGKLARLDLKAEEKGKTKARVEKDLAKKNSHDFVLWFTKSKFDDQEMKWDSPWGVGYPGWHIECSAMATKYLGSQFDIHCGGIDHIPVHHTNEIAQSEAALGVNPWSRFWLHNEFLVVGAGEKMAKSGENFLTLDVLGGRGIEPLDYRFFCLGTHYRNPLMFSWEALEGAKSARRRLVEKVLELKKDGAVVLSTLSEGGQGYLAAFAAAVGDDMNTPKALALVWDVLRDEELSGSEKYTVLLRFDSVLGFNLDLVVEEKIPAVVVKLAQERLAVRVGKEWKKSDELRDKIKDLGYIVGDTKDGFELKKI